MKDLSDARRTFAEELRTRLNIRSGALVSAFATVPRETFLGPPPWRVWDPRTAPVEAGTIPYRTTDDPAALYRDVLVALDPGRGINNGQPSLWAIVYDRMDARPGDRIVHVGCGVGYYTAILAEMTGTTGSVVAMDIEPGLVARARTALSAWPHVEVKARNGADYDEGPGDIIVVNAGITHPLEVWLDALRPDGRLVLPLTTDGERPEAGMGGFFRITRNADGFAAAFLCPTGIFHFTGARDVHANQLLARAWREQSASVGRVASLRRDVHPQDTTCWVHGDGYCLSLAEPGSIH